MLQQFTVIVEVPQEGPRGGYRKPLVKRFLVAAESREDARETFGNDMPDYLEHVVSIAGCLCRTMPIN